MTNDTLHGYTYDAEGNITKVDSGSTATYTYNALNQRVKTVVGTATTEFVFNANGQRVSEWNASTHGELKGHYYWGSKPVAYYDYIGTHFQHQDWLGTERMRTSSNGSVEGTYTSFPWGDSEVPTGTDTDANHFATLDHDTESNTDHAEFRQYSNTQGRFLSPDPYDGSYDPTNPQSMNRYVYALNNPLSNIDPSGRDCTYTENGSTVYVRGDCYDDGDDGVYTNCDGCLMGLPTNSPNDSPIDLDILMAVWNWAAQQTTPVNGLWTYGNWAGSGGEGAPIDNLDALAMTHDYCYHLGGFTAGSNYGGHNDALQACNQALCNGASIVEAKSLAPIEAAALKNQVPNDPGGRLMDRANAAADIIRYFSIVPFGNSCKGVNP